MLKRPAAIAKNAAIPIVGIGFAAFIAMMILFPGPSMQAALKGIAIWWDVLFPALFPFLVISEVMLGVGVVHFIGTLLDPMMRPLFRVPGIGGFVMAIGFAAGYPVGGKLTAQLRRQGLVNQAEGERLVAFTTTSDPIFVIGAVSIGFFHHAGIALLLVTAHYGSAVLIGLAMRFYKAGQISAPPAVSEPHIRQSLIARALHAMHEARKEDGRSLGTLLQDAVRISLGLILVIGGLVVFFSTVMEMLKHAGVLQLMISAAGRALEAFGLPGELSHAVVNGLFEVTLGAQAAGTAASAVTLRDSAAVAALVLSWAGLSVHAQVVSLISATDMRYLPFMAARFAHGVLSCLWLYVTWPLMYPYAEKASVDLQRLVFAREPFGTAADALQYGLFLFLAAIGTICAVYLVTVIGAGIWRVMRFFRRTPH